MLLKKEKEVKKEKNKPTRKQRRANIASERKIAGNKMKRDKAVLSFSSTELKRKRLAEKVAKAKKKTEERIKVKREIATKEGVNIGRVVLQGKGNRYVIRESKREIEAKKKAELKKIKQDKYNKKNVKTN